MALHTELPIHRTGVRLQTLADLRNREQPMDVDRARAVAQVASVLVDTAICSLPVTTEPLTHEDTMTTPHRTLREAAQMALDALLTGYHQGTQDAIAAMREALAAPEPKPVALESVHLTRDTKGMCVVRVNGRIAIRDNGDIIDHMATLEWFAAPPAAPAEDHATPSGGQEAGPQEDRIEAAYWRFDARRSGYARWKAAPMSERDAFKAEMRNALEAEKVRAEMRLVARGWRRPDTPAAPAPAAPVVREPRRVRKVGGSFQHTGAVVAEFKTTAGEPRIVLEFDAPVAGMLHVYRPDQVEPCEPVAPAAPPAAPAPAQPVPLTQDQIADCTRTAHRACDAKGPMTRWSTEFARAIEAAHGITGGKP